MYKVKVTGEYILGGKMAEIDSYETEFALEESREDYARAIIQNGLLTSRLRKELTNFKRWRTCEVVSIDKIDKKVKAKVDVEIEKLLAEATELGCVPVNYENYKSNAVRKRRLKEAIDKKKAAVIKFKQKNKVQDQGWVD